MIVFVTGASAGFGEATVRRFTRDGARVIAAARRRGRLDGLRAEFGDALLPLELDVRDRAAVGAAIASLPQAFAEIDVLVNNAGLAVGLEPAQAAELDDWDAMVDTNIKGLMYMTRAVLPGMVAQSRTRRQPGIDRGGISVSRRKRLRCEQGVRSPVFAEPARRFAWHPAAGYRHRTGTRWGHRVLTGSFQG